MKKLLCVFGAIGLASSISGNVVSCGKSKDWFSLPTYPKDENKMVSLALDFYNDSVTYSNGLYGDWFKTNPVDGSTDPSADFLLKNDNSQKNLIYNYAINYGLAYILGVLDADETAQLKFKDADATNSEKVITAISKTQLEDSITSDQFTATVSSSYKTYYEKIIVWAEIFSTFQWTL